MFDLVEKHVKEFGETPRVFKAPGRVNLIGEHTDYNDGYVLPTPINRYIWVAITPREDNGIHLHALDLGEKLEYHSSHITVDPTHSWANYVLGVVDSLQKKGAHFTGFNLSIHGDIPQGAGLSSSAALETATIRGLNEVYRLGLTPVEVAYIGKECENNFVGVQSGIMDQFVSSVGEMGKALFIDCRTNDHSLYKLSKGYRVVILNSMVQRELVNSEYNTRMAQCMEAVSIIKEDYPKVVALRDVNMEMLNNIWGKLSDVVARRSRHVVGENARVLEARSRIEVDDMEGFGGLMYDSHHSLRYDYEVSCEHLDILVDSTKDIEACLGARMTGAGFGGCTVNLVEEGCVDLFVEKVSKRYHEATGLLCEVYMV